MEKTMTIKSGHVTRELLAALAKQGDKKWRVRFDATPNLHFSLRRCYRGDTFTGGMKLTAEQVDNKYAPRHRFSFEYNLPANAKNVKARLSYAVDRAFRAANAEFTLQSMAQSLQKLIKNKVGDVYTKKNDKFSDWVENLKEKTGRSATYPDMTADDMIFWADTIRNKFKNKQLTKSFK
jgi:hypothetical protein